MKKWKLKLVTPLYTISYPVEAETNKEAIKKFMADFIESELTEFALFCYAVK